jgi:arylsulfatase A-like enzyme
MDEQFGRIIQVLAERKFMNKTVIVFTSDHGYIPFDVG